MLNSFFSSKRVCERYCLLAGLVLSMGLGLAAWGAPPPPQMAPQEFEAIKNMSAIRQAQTDYWQVNFSYAATFANLSGPNPVYLACDFSAPVGDYTYTLTLTATGYSVIAEPSDSAWVHLYGDPTGIFSAYNATASPASAPMTLNLGLGSCYSTEGGTIAANQTAAMADLCAIAAAQVSYYLDNLNQYALLLDDLDIGDFSGVRNGYSFAMTSDGNTYSVTADPDVMNTSGLRGFYLDETGIVRAEDGGIAGPGSIEYTAQCDSDRDGLNNLDETFYLTDYKLADTDGDDMSDRDEVLFGYDPLDLNDSAPLPVTTWVSVMAVMMSLAAGGFVLRRKHSAVKS